MTTVNLILIVTAVLSALLEIIDTSIVNVAIPTMMGNLGVTLDQISWVSTAYMIANSIVLPIAAWFGMRLGRRNYFTGAILVFTLASLACGMAPNLIFLVIFRLIQGFAGGALLPTSQVLIQEQFPKEKATLAMGIFGMSVMLGPALGPVLGGYLTDHLGWRSIFNVNVPLGLIAGALSYFFVKDTEVVSQEKKTASVDWGGFALLTLGVGSFQYVLERGQTDGWFDANSIIVMSILALVGIVGFIFWELKVPNPIMNLRLFKNNEVSAGSVMMLSLGIVLYSLTFVVPIFVDNVMHLTATDTGMLFIPGSIATSFTMASMDALSKRFHPRALILFGIALAGLSVIELSHATTSTGSGDLYIPLIIRGIALGFLFIPIISAVNGPFRGEELEQVSGMMNFFRQVGGSIGIASLSTILTRFGKQNYVDLMPKMSVLSKGGYSQLLNTSHELSAGTLHANSGMGLAESMGIKALWARTMSQGFIMSFNQLCWIVLFVLFVMVIPTLLMKMPKRLTASTGAH